MTVTDTLSDLAARDAAAHWVPPVPDPAGPVAGGPGDGRGPERSEPGLGGPPYPLYWLVRSWNGTEPDEIGRGILERAIYVSALAGREDHEAAVEIITDALCRWAHPDDIRWCHLPDGGTGGYTIVGRAIRSVSQADGYIPGDDYPE